MSDLFVAWYAVGWIALLMNAKHFGWLEWGDLFVSFVFPPIAILFLLMFICKPKNSTIWRGSL